MLLRYRYAYISLHQRILLSPGRNQYITYNNVFRWIFWRNISSIPTVLRNFKSTFLPSIRRSRFNISLWSPHLHAIEYGTSFLSNFLRLSHGIQTSYGLSWRFILLLARSLKTTGSVFAREDGTGRRLKWMDFPSVGSVFIFCSFESGLRQINPCAFYSSTAVCNHAPRAFLLFVCKQHTSASICCLTVFLEIYTIYCAKKS